MNRTFLMVIGVLAIVTGGLFFANGNAHNSQPASTSSSTSTIHIVAAENFYGDVARQLGGSHVDVTSILSDPNVDPHEYESNVQDSVALSQANIVIKNGLEYDTWIDKLLAAAPKQDRVVITAGEIAPHKLENNPHVWYGIENMPVIAESITDALKKNDPADAPEFDQNLATFKNSLAPIQQKIADIKSSYDGTPIGLTETIYLYQTQPAGLNVLTPLTFEQAIAEGNDPSAAGVIETNAQVTKKQIRLLIVNSQTVTPLTTNLQNAAKKQNIPIVTVTETMPQNKNYQSWMLDQLSAVQAALQTVSQK